jgi:hypothetical protein
VSVELEMDMDAAVLTVGGGFDLDDGHKQIQEHARALAAELDPVATEADASSELYEPMRSALAASGLAAHVVPAAYGGHSETLDPLAITVIREALMYSSAHLDSLFGVQGIGSSKPLPPSPSPNRKSAPTCAPSRQPLNRSTGAFGSEAASPSSPTAAPPPSTACWGEKATDTPWCWFRRTPRA